MVGNVISSNVRFGSKAAIHQILVEWGSVKLVFNGGRGQFTQLKLQRPSPESVLKSGPMFDICLPRQLQTRAFQPPN